MIVPVGQQHFLEEEYESHQQTLFTARLGAGVLASACRDQWMTADPSALPLRAAARAAALVSR